MRPQQRPAAAEWPLWEVFVRSKAGLDHKHCGSLHAPDAEAGACSSRATSTRGARKAPASGSCARDQIVASDPGRQGRCYFDPMEDKVYRHPTFYELPESVNHM